RAIGDRRGEAAGLTLVVRAARRDGSAVGGVGPVPGVRGLLALRPRATGRTVRRAMRASSVAVLRIAGGLARGVRPTRRALAFALRTRAGLRATVLRLRAGLIGVHVRTRLRTVVARGSV